MDWHKMIGQKVKTPGGRYGTILSRGAEPNTYEVKMGPGEHHVYHASDIVLVPSGGNLTLEQLSLLEDARVACVHLQRMIGEYAVNESGRAELASVVVSCSRALEALVDMIPELPDDPGALFSSGERLASPAF
jgi:hypothetical protein